MELEVTWNRAIRVWWSYLWRNLIAIIAAMIAGGIMGGILGLILGLLGVSPGTIKLIAMPIGGVMGLAISIVPLKMILGKDFGEFRVVLLSKETPPILPVHQGTANQSPLPNQASGPVG